MLNSDLKKFLTRVFIYSFILLGTAALIQYIIDKGLQKYDSDNYGIWNKIFQGKINSEIIVQGSSRSLVQFDPKIIEENTGLTCFNLGISGGRFIMQKAKWDSYIANNKPPKILIQNVDIMVMRKENFIFNKVQYIPYLDQPSVSSNLGEIDKNIRMENIIPLYKYRGYHREVFLGLKSYFNLISARSEDKTYKGFISVNKTWNKDFEKFKGEHKEIIHSHEDIRFGYNFLENLMRDCKKRNIKLILVHAPIYSELLQLTPQKNLIDSLFLNLVNKYDMSYWDYTNLPICNSKEYFYNSTHLNSAGAKIFSEIFANDLSKFIQQDVELEFTTLKNFKSHSIESQN